MATATISALRVFTTAPSVLASAQSSIERESEQPFHCFVSLGSDSSSDLPGLVLGLSSLARSFAPASNVSLVKSSKHRIVILNPQNEDSLWIALKIRIPSGANVCDQAYEAMLSRLWSRFTLLHNTVRFNLKASFVELQSRILSLETRMDAVFASYIDTFDIHRLDLSICLEGPTSLPLNPLVHLKASFIIMHDVISSLSSLISPDGAVEPLTDVKCLLLLQDCHVPFAPFSSELLPLYFYLIDLSTGLSSGDGGIACMSKPKGVPLVSAVASCLLPDTPILHQIRKSVKSARAPFTGFVIGPEQEHLATYTDGWAGAKVVHLAKPDAEEGEDDMTPWRIVVYQFKEDLTLALLVRDGPASMPPLALWEYGSTLREKLDPLHRLLLDVHGRVGRERGATESRFLRRSSVSGTVTGNLGASKTFVAGEDAVSSLVGHFSDLHGPGRVPISEIHTKLISEIWTSASKQSFGTGAMPSTTLTVSACGGEAGSIVKGASGMGVSSGGKSLADIGEEHSRVRERR
ncbi:hypothetical protein BC830DRAFT_1094082 [Chytriomyces sp. MP71]|nr:hypothetical protein BC830DRAFT_1094082 [Chytriomyces sp. MP71]